MLSPAFARRAILRAMAREDIGTLITLRWVTLTGTTTDRTTGAVLGTPTIQAEEVRGFIHFIQPAVSDVRIFNELAVGDAMIDLPPETEIADRTQLEFLVDGQTWVQKKVSEKLMEYWDVLLGGERFYRTVAVMMKR